MIYYNRTNGQNIPYGQNISYGQNMSYGQNTPYIENSNTGINSELKSLRETVNSLVDTRSYRQINMTNVNEFLFPIDSNLMMKRILIVAYIILIIVLIK